MTDEAKEKEEEKPQFLTKAEMEAMLTAQESKFMGALGRLAEVLTPKGVETPRGDEGKKGGVSFFEKPEEAANALFDAKMAPLKQAYTANEKTRQLAEVAAMPFAAKYLDEIKKVIETVPAEIQIQPGFAVEAYNLVLGRHRDEVFKAMQEEKEKSKPEFTETATAGAPSGRKSETLSAQEREAANGMGMSEDEYKKWRDNPDAMATAAMAPTKKAS